MIALLSCLCSYTHLIAGLTNRTLRELIAGRRQHLGGLVLSKSTAFIRTLGINGEQASTSGTGSSGGRLMRRGSALWESARADALYLDCPAVTGQLTRLVEP